MSDHTDADPWAALPTIPLGSGARDFDDVAREDGLGAVRSALRSPVALAAGVSLSDFYAYMPTHQYIFAPSRELWPSSSVNARLRPQVELDHRGRPCLDDKGKQKFIPAATWLDREKPVEQMTWAPGEPMIIKDRLVSEGGWIRRPGCSCFNLYRPPVALRGEASQAGRWIDHVRLVYPDAADHIIAWLAHRVQRPQEKINHALVLGGSQGIGKDSLLEPVKQAVGAWNFAEVSPAHLLGRFNGFVKSVILRVSEARDLGDVDRYAFYEHMKTYTAAPPDVLRVDEKHMREYSAFNVCGVIITTNHKTDGIYLEPDDRRHFVAWSELSRDDFAADYWATLYAWFAAGGIGHVAAYLRTLDLSGFNPKAPPRHTDAFRAIVMASSAPEDAEMADAIDKLGRPPAVTIANIASAAGSEFAAWLKDRRNSRQAPHRLSECGYEVASNPATAQGLWSVAGTRMKVYARKDLSVRDRIAAAENLVANTRFVH